VWRIWGEGRTCRISMGKQEGKKPLEDCVTGRLTFKCVVKEIGWKGLGSNRLVQGQVTGLCVHGNEHSRSTDIPGAS
jgi:hypothetical protein